MMKWLAAIFVLLLLALAGLPTAIDAVAGWVAHRSASVESINYIARDVNELSASRRRGSHKHDRKPDQDSH
jgi:hypothetical protein